MDEEMGTIAVCIWVKNKGLMLEDAEKMLLEKEKELEKIFKGIFKERFKEVYVDSKYGRDDWEEHRLKGGD